MLRIDRILGSRVEAPFADALHDLAHAGAVDVLTLAAGDVGRRRMRTISEGGEDLAISLPRDQTLYDGAVLLLDQARAIVVRVAEQRWLRLAPHTTADAIELGYHAGNLHWRVRFAGAALLVALEAPVADYLSRLGDLAAPERLAWAEVADAM